MKLTNAAREAYENLSDADKDVLNLAKEVLAAHVIYSVLRATLVHTIGRKVAPQIFTSFGRSYAIAFLARLAVKSPQLSDDQRSRLLAYKQAQRDAKTGQEQLNA